MDKESDFTDAVYLMVKLRKSMIHDVKFIKPINLFLRVAFLLLILFELRRAVVLINAYANHINERIAVIFAGGTLYETMLVLIFSIAGFIGTFGISMFKEWGRIILIYVFSLFIFLRLYTVYTIFNLQLKDNFGSPVVALSGAYLKLAWQLMLCCVLGLLIYYFSQPNVRNVFKNNLTNQSTRSLRSG